MKAGILFKKVCFALFILSCLIVIGSVAMMIAEYFIDDLFRGWTAGILFFMLLGIAAVLNIAAIPFSIAALKNNCDKKWKVKLPLYFSPIALLYFLYMGVLLIE